MADRSDNDARPHVISLCGTFLKPEMQSIYRQVIGLKRVRTTVYTQSHENEEMFPFEPSLSRICSLQQAAAVRALGRPPFEPILRLFCATGWR